MRTALQHFISLPFSPSPLPLVFSFLAFNTMAAGSSAENPFFEAVLGNTLHHTPLQRGITPDSLVKLYIWDNANLKPMFVGVAKAMVQPNPDESVPKTFRSTLHGHDVEDYMMVLENFKFYVEKGQAVTDVMRNLPYPYKNNYRTTDDRIDHLGGLEGVRIPFVWDNRAMLAMTAVPASVSNSSASSRQHNHVSQTEATSRAVVEVTDSVQKVTVVDLVGNDEEKEEFKDSNGREFTPNKFDRTIYREAHVRVKIDQINDVETPLRGEQEQHVKSIMDSMLDPRVGYDKTKGMMTVTLLEKDFANNYSLNSVIVEASRRPGYEIPENNTVSIVDGRHRRKSISRISKMQKPELNWSREYLDVVIRYRYDFVTLTDWEVLMLSSSENNVSVLVLETTSVVDILKTIDSYATVFNKSYNLSFVEAKTSLIFQDMKATNFLGTMSDTTIKRYIRWSKAIMPYTRVKEFLYSSECTFANQTRGKLNNITYINEYELFNSNEEEMFFMLKCAEAFFSSSKGKKFYAKPFYLMCKFNMDRLRRVYNNIRNGHSTLPVPPPVPMDFFGFMTTPFNSTISMQLTPLRNLQNIMQIFKYDEVDKGAKARTMSKSAMSRATKKLYIHYGVPDPDINVVVPAKKKTAQHASVHPSRNLRRSGQGVITIDDENEPPKKKPKTRRGTRNPDSKKTTPATQPRSQSTKTKRSNRPSTTLSVHTLTNDNDANENEPFDDSMDLDKVPAGYEDIFKVVREHFQNDFTVTIEDICIMRRYPFQRNRDEEGHLREMRTVVPAAESFNNNNIVDTNVYLRSIGIPENHRAHLFCDYECIKFYRNLACLWALHIEEHKVGGIHSLEGEMTMDYAQRWRTSIARFKLEDYRYNHHLSEKAFFDRKKSEYDMMGYTILQGMADPLGMTVDVGLTEVAARTPPGLPDMSNADWFLNLFRMFPGEEYLANMENRVDWNPICNTGIDATDNAHNSMGIGRYQSTNRFVTEVLEQQPNIALAYKRAHIDVWIAILASFLGLDNVSPEEDIENIEQLFLPVTGGRLLFTGRECQVQTGHNDFVIRLLGQLVGCFVILTGQEQVSLWVTDHSHTFMFYPDNVKKTLIENLRMKRVTIPGNSVFFGHGYLHHAGDKYLGSHCLRYHVYLRPTNVEIPNAIMFNHGDGRGPKYNDDGTLEIPGRTRTKNAKTTGDTSTNNGQEASGQITSTPNLKRLQQQDNGDDPMRDSSSEDDDHIDDPNFDGATEIEVQQVPDD